MTTQDKIRNMQTFLNKYYKANLKVDGIYGPKTKEAVKNMQRQLGGIDVDGWWGVNTQKALGNFNKDKGRIAPNFGATLNDEGQQDTTINDLAFMYKPSALENTASTSTAITATATGNVSNSVPSPSLSPQSTQSGNVGNKSHIDNGILPGLTTNALHNGNFSDYFKNFFTSIFRPHPRAQRYRKRLYGLSGFGSGQPDVTAMRYGGKILMNFITK